MGDRLQVIGWGRQVDWYGAYGLELNHGRSLSGNALSPRSEV